LQTAIFKMNNTYKLAIVAAFCLCTAALNTTKAQNVVWKKNFGGSGSDYFNAVTAAHNAIFAVGYSPSNSFGNGDWTGVSGKGSDDAIIVKYDTAGNMVWRKNFGGSGKRKHHHQRQQQRHHRAGVGFAK